MPAQVIQSLEAKAHPLISAAVRQPQQEQALVTGYKQATEAAGSGLAHALGSSDMGVGGRPGRGWRWDLQGGQLALCSLTSLLLYSSGFFPVTIEILSQGSHVYRCP